MKIFKIIETVNISNNRKLLFSIKPHCYLWYLFLISQDIMCIVFCLFQVYAWGCGACLGCGSSEATALRPKLIEELATTRIVDMSIGDSHCLALSHGKILCF